MAERGKSIGHSKEKKKKAVLEHFGFETQQNSDKLSSFAGTHFLDKERRDNHGCSDCRAEDMAEKGARLGGSDFGRFTRTAAFGRSAG